MGGNEVTVGDYGKGLTRPRLGSGFLERGRRVAAALSLVALALLVAAATALAETGELTQLASTDGCVSATGSFGECANGKVLDGPESVAVSGDGKSVYVAVSGSSSTDQAVSVFRRDTTTGVVTQLGSTAGCVSEFGSGGICADGKALGGPRSVAVSADGKNVYVASFFSDAVAVFARDTTTGALTQLAGTAGCVSETGTTSSGDACTDAKALDGPVSVAVSADGKNAYVASAFTGGVSEFQRDITTGELTQLGGGASCVSETGRGPCRNGTALSNAHDVTVSPDDKSVYVTSEGLTSDPVSERGAVAVFRRNTTTGALFQPAAACVSEGGSGGACADGKALSGASGVAVRPDGQRVYVAAPGSDAVAVFRRNATTSALSQLVGGDGLAGCVSETGSGGECRNVKALLSANSVAVSADGESVYVTSRGILDEDDIFERGAVAIFRANPALGGLTQTDPFGTGGCVSETGSAGNCVDGKALVGANSVAVSTDSKNVYVTSGGPSSSASDAVTVFARETPP